MRRKFRKTIVVLVTLSVLVFTPAFIANAEIVVEPVTKEVEQVYEEIMPLQMALVQVEVVVRQGHPTNAFFPVAGWIPRGTTVTVLGSHSGWVNIHVLQGPPGNANANGLVGRRDVWIMPQALGF